MFEWWCFFLYCCMLGTILGGAAEHPLGWLLGLIIGLVVGASPPVGPRINFDPNDL